MSRVPDDLATLAADDGAPPDTRPSAAFFARQPQVRPRDPGEPGSAGELPERYHLLRELGRGGYGVVYLAVDGRTDRLVAVKVPAPGATHDPDLHARFVREAYSLIAVSCEHVVGVREVGTCPRRPFYVMDFVPGHTLHDHVRTLGTVGEDDARGVLRGLLRALQAVHVRNLVHRDVKPANVVLREGALQRPVLVDFGLARLDQDLGLTDPDLMLGTPEFLPAETVRTGAFDLRGDLYAAGITTRFALCGTTPFAGMRALGLLDAVARGPSPVPADVASGGMRALLDALCAREPEHRPPSAEAALRWLDGLGPAGPDVRPLARGEADPHEAKTAANPDRA